MEWRKKLSKGNEPIFFSPKTTLQYKKYLVKLEKVLSIFCLAFFFLFSRPSPFTPPAAKQAFYAVILPKRRKLGRKNKMLFPSRSKNRHIISTPEKNKEKQRLKDCERYLCSFRLFLCKTIFYDSKTPDRYPITSFSPSLCSLIF